MSNKANIYKIIATAHSGLGTNSAAECMDALKRLSSFLLTVSSNMGREMTKARDIFQRVLAGDFEEKDAAVIRTLVAKAKTVIRAAGGPNNKRALREDAPKLERLAQAIEKYFKGEAAREAARAKLTAPAPMLSVTSRGCTHTGNTEVHLAGRKVGGIIGIKLEAGINDVWRATIDCYVDAVDVKAIVEGINYHNKPQANSRGEVDVTTFNDESRKFSRGG